MSLVIVGQEKSKTNIRLLREAKKRFGSVFLAPIEMIRLGLNTKFGITYRTSDLLKFDAVYPRIPFKYYSYAYQLLSLFPPETFMPIKPITFLLSSERFFMLSVLRKRNIDTINIHLARSSKAAYGILEEIDFPVIIRIPGRDSGVVVKTLSEAKSVIDALGSLKKPILVEDVVDKLVSVYVASPDAVAAVRKKSKEKDVVFSKGELKKHKMNLEIKHLALEAAKSIDTQLARIDISVGKDKMGVASVNLTPGLVKASSITGVNIVENFVERIHDNYQSHKEKPLLMKFFDDAKSVMKDVLKDKHMI